MFAEIWQPALEDAFSLVFHTAHGRDQHSYRRHDARLLHDDVEIFFRAKIGGETTFIHDIIREAQAHFLRDQAARAMCDIPKRPGVDKSGCAVGGLGKIGKDRFAQQRHHAAGCRQISCANRFPLPRDANNDRVQPLAQVLAVSRKGDDSHDFRSRGDNEAGLAVGVFLLAIEREANVAQRAVVHIHGARPGNLRGIEM